VRAAILLALLAACRPKPDMETRCHGIVEHLRMVSKMPMREGDVAMLMGSCTMWMEPTLACMEATANDDDIARCKAAIK